MGLQQLQQVGEKAAACEKNVYVKTYMHIPVYDQSLRMFYRKEIKWAAEKRLMT